MLDRKVKVMEIRDLGALNYHLILNATEQARLVQPGQFVMIKCSYDLDENPLLRRPFSVFNIPRQSRSGRVDGLGILVKAVGVGTKRLAGLRTGDEVYALGPQGHPFEMPSRVERRVHVAYLIAGGVGIAALYLLAQDLLARNIDPILFYGGRTKEDLVLREYFERLEMKTICTTEDGSHGEAGLVTAPLERFLKTRSRINLQLYCCGPWAMMKASHKLAAKYHVPCDVSLEARMGCSLGACMGCVVHVLDGNEGDEYRRVCQEGPIMNSRTVDWDVPPF